MRVLLVFFLICLAPLAAGGNAADPDVVDPKNDHAGWKPTNSGCNPAPGGSVYPASDFTDVDITALWFDQTLESDTVVIGLALQTAPVEDSQYYVDLNVKRGNDTLPQSSADPEGIGHRVQYTGGAYGGVEGGAATVSGTQVLFVVPKDSLGIAGGEEISAFRAIAQRRTMDVIPVLCADDYGYRDTTDAISLLALRAPVVSAVNMSFVNVTVGDVPAETIDLPDGVGLIDAKVLFNNTGNGWDNYTLNLTTPAGVEASLEHNYTELQIGQEALVNLTAKVSGLAPGQHRLIVTATSMRDGVVHIGELVLNGPLAGAVDAPVDGEPSAPGADGLADNSTADVLSGDEAGKESPGLVLPLLLMVLVGAAIRRR